MESLIVDVSKLLKYNLSFQQFFILYSLCHKEFDILYEYLGKGNHDYDQAIMLEVNGYIESLVLNAEGEIVYKDIVLTDKAYEFLGFSRKDSWFKELWDMYPRFTSNGRILKQISKAKAKKKYTSRVNSVDEHRVILKALEKELMHRQIHNNMQYMQNFETWLNNESWNAFKEDNTVVVQKPYGSDVE